MSIEFDVKVPSSFSMEKLLELARKRLRDAECNFSIMKADVSEDLWGEMTASGRIQLDGNIVEISCQSIGDEKNFGADGGFWFTSEAHRTGSSALLAAIVATCLAELVSSTVIDEWKLLSGSRELQASVANQYLSSLFGHVKFEEAGRRFAQHIGLAE
jgi:hypothetical protein